jgi:hypothetical protein
MYLSDPPGWVKKSMRYRGDRIRNVCGLCCGIRKHSPLRNSEDVRAYVRVNLSFQISLFRDVVELVLAFVHIRRRFSARLSKPLPELEAPASVLALCVER